VLGRFEFRCEDGSKLSVTFALDRCDRETIGWVASPTGYSGDDIRDLILESVEKRFGDQLPVTSVQWLNDNGSAYTAEQTRLFARQIGWQPVPPPGTQPTEQLHGRELREDDRARLGGVYTQTGSGNGVAQPGNCLRTLQRAAPHSALNYRSPREFRRLAAASI